MALSKKPEGFLSRNGKPKLRILLSALLVVVALVNVFSEQLAASFNFESFWSFRKAPKNNVIFFVTDGMGPASLSLSRSFRQYTQDLPIDDVLTLDDHFIGSSRTRSSDSLITDSAAGATAFSCGLKSYNGAIGVDSDKNPCGTLLEGAKLQGYLTGLVVTTRITDATPAAFSAHADYRFQEDLIALHQLGEYPLGRSVDLMLGGGRTHFYPPDADSKYGSHGSRADGRNLIEEAQENGWQYAGSREEFDQLQNGHNVSLPLLGLFADNDIPFDIDRKDDEYPSLEEEAMTAINALTKATEGSDKGFFLMIEGSRIDHAGHQNDPAAQAREVLAFDRAFKAVIDYVENSDTETIIISTSDHETGGLTIGRQVTPQYPEYIWFPRILEQAKHSGEYLTSKFLAFKDSASKKDERSFVKEELFEKGLSIKDYTEDDVDAIISAPDSGRIKDKLNDMVSFRAEIGWTTHGHSAVDVNIYAYANKEITWKTLLQKLQGNHENTEIGQFMADFLEIDFAEVTKKVRDTKHSPKPADVSAQSDLHDDYYHKLN